MSGRGYSGANRRLIDRRWLELGGEIRDVPRHGEADYVHPLLPGRRARVNVRRKDATRELTGMLAAVERLKGVA